MRSLKLKRPQFKRPSVALGVSVFALVAALGGTSYAVGKINTQDIKNGAVTSGKIQNGTIKVKDLTPGLRNFIAQAGEPGPQGPAGPAGPQGPAGDGAEPTRWLLVNADGEIEAQSGGFTVAAGYPVLANTAPDGQPNNELRANGNFYIDSGASLDGVGIVASIALQNTVDVDGGGMAGRTPGADTNAEFSGEISVSRCNIGAPTTPPSGPTNCAPAPAQNANSFVVSPRNSDGSVTTDETRKRFYVVLTPAA